MALKTLNQYPQLAMDHDSCHLFAQFCLMNDTQAQQVWEKAHTSSQGQILAGRMPAGTLPKIDRRVLSFVTTQINSPGRAVLWAYTLHRLAQDHGYYYFAQFTHDFAAGFPDEAGYFAAWDAQKDKGANLLDLPETWA